MRDQAEKLREMISNLKIDDKKSQDANTAPSDSKRCRVITVTSGKGGVGKTNISVNLALNLSQMGYRVILLDADFGLANIEVLFGISSQYTLLDVINSEKNIFDIISDGPMNVKFISGGSGIEEMSNLQKWQLNTVMEKMALLDQIADIVIVDTGAGVSDKVVSFISAADDVVLVTTPEPTALMDAYALVKTATLSNKNKKIQLIVNRAESVKEAFAASNKLIIASEKFLGVKLEQLGYVLYDTSVVKAVKQQQPFILSYPKSLVTRQLNEIACNLISENKEAVMKSTGIRGFFNKLSNIINA